MRVILAVCGQSATSPGLLRKMADLGLNGWTVNAAALEKLLTSVSDGAVARARQNKAAVGRSVFGVHDVRVGCSWTVALAMRGENVLEVDTWNS